MNSIGFVNPKYYSLTLQKINYNSCTPSFKGYEGFGYLIAQGTNALLDKLKLKSSLDNYQAMENVVNIAAGIIYERSNSRQKGIAYNRADILKQVSSEFNDSESTLWVCALLKFIETAYDSKQGYLESLLDSFKNKDFVFPSSTKGKLEFASCLLYLSALKMKNALRQTDINTNPKLLQYFYIAKQNSHDILFTSTVVAKPLSKLVIDINYQNKIVAEMTNSLSSDPISQIPEGFKRIILNSDIDKSIKTGLAKLGLSILTSTGKKYSELYAFFQGYLNQSESEYTKFKDSLNKSEPEKTDEIRNIDKRFSTASGEVRNLQEALQILEIKKEELTMENLTKKYRKLSREFHPQFHADEYDKYNTYMVMINLARDYVVKYYINK